VFTADSQTYDAVKKLWGLGRESKKPLLIWVGAGASSWLGYERWADLASRFHQTFLRRESRYRRAEAAEELNSQNYPAVFQRCHDANSQTYFTLLSEALGPREMKPVYERFLAAVRRVDGASILTTNADETLERSLPGFDLLQHSDLARALSLITSKAQFIGKLHGSISSVQSTVFTTHDYEVLVGDGTFMEVLRSLLTTCSVVFIGYSLRDQYLLDLLGRNADLLSLFGDGPHFLISAEDRPGLPESVNVIRYRTDLHTDHRSGILAVELLGRPPGEVDSLRYDRAKSPPLQSAHFLSDFYPGGTWSAKSGQVLGVRGEDGTESQIVIGPAWTDEELPPAAASAAFDLAVGLICFDRVVLLIGSVGSAFQTLGEDLFYRLVAEDVLQFVQYDGDDGVMFTPPLAAFGSIVTGKAPGHTPIVMIKRQLSPLPGREELAGARFELLESKVKRVDLSGTLNFADVCNGLLISPVTRNTLGLSEATPVGHIPRWAAAPAIRLTLIARAGATCQMLGISSMKLMAGASQVAQVAFSALAGGALAQEVAAYTLTGQFGVIPDSALAGNPAIWATIMAFRVSSEGTSLRSYVLKYLEANQGAEIVASIDAGLRQALPNNLLDEARHRMSALLLATPGRLNITPGIWSDASRLWNGPAAWRLKSRSRLEGYLRERRLGPYDLCPCGSYEKVKFCCQAALEQP